MELTDGRVTLKTPTEADADRVATAVQDSLETLQPWMPWATDGYDTVSALQWISGELEPTAIPLMILDPDGRFIGSSGLNMFDRVNDRANLGYWLRADATGFGYATAATRLIAKHGIQEEGLHRIEIMMSVENERSRLVAERVGAHYEGILRGRLWCEDRHHDAHSYAILAETETESGH